MITKFGSRGTNVDQRNDSGSRSADGKFTFLFVLGWWAAVSYGNRMPLKIAIPLYAMATFGLFVLLRYSSHGRRLRLRVLLMGVALAALSCIALTAVRILPSSQSGFTTVFASAVLIVFLQSEFTLGTRMGLWIAWAGALLLELSSVDLVPYGVLIGWIIFGAGVLTVAVPRIVGRLKTGGPPVESTLHH